MVTINNSSFTNNSIAVSNYHRSNISESNFTNNHIGVWANGTIDHILSSNITNSEYAGLVIYNNNTLINNDNITNNHIGILLGYNNSVVDIPVAYWNSNNIRSNTYALSINGSRNTLENGTIDNNTNGIIVNGDDNNLKYIILRELIDTGLIFNNTATGNSFHRGIIGKNNVGVLIRGPSNSVTSSDVIDNTETGFTVTGTNNKINYNRIYKNGLGMNNSGINTNANLNWWGRNNAQSQVINHDPDTMVYWYVLQLSVNEFDTLINAIKDYHYGTTVLLSYNLETNRPINNNPEFLPYFEVNVISPYGKNTTGDIRDTTLSYFVTGSEGEIFKIQALSDDEDLVLTINFDKSPEPPTPPIPPIPVPPTPNPIQEENNVKTAMQNTGMPIVAILIVLLSSLGILSYRKKE